MNINLFEFPSFKLKYKWLIGIKSWNNNVLNWNLRNLVDPTMTTFVRIQDKVVIVYIY